MLSGLRSMAPMLVFIVLLGMSLAPSISLLPRAVADDSQEDQLIDDFCVPFNKLFVAALEISKEKEIAKVSGTYDVSDAHEAGRIFVAERENMITAAKAYKKKLKKDPNPAECVAFHNASEADRERVQKTIAEMHLDKRKL